MLALTIQLYLSGGASNPFIYLYLLQGILSAVPLQSHYTWVVVAASFVGVTGLTIFNQPLHVQFATQEGLPSLYVVGVLISFALTSILTIVFLRALWTICAAATAASPICASAPVKKNTSCDWACWPPVPPTNWGTPMATMSVILGDWQHMPALMQDPDLREDLQEMQRQLLRCKSIVSGVLLSAGETRAEGTESTTFVSFVEGVVSHWQSHNSLQHFALRNEGAADFAMLSDTALQQMICNLLDNALEASPAGWS